MKYALLIFSVLCLFFSCTTDNGKNKSIEGLLQNDVDYILETENLKSFLTNIASPEIFENGLILNTSLKDQFEHLQTEAHEGPVYITFRKNDQESAEYLFMALMPPKKVVPDSVQNADSLETRDLSQIAAIGKDIHEFKAGETTAYKVYADNIIFASNSREVLEKALKNAEDPLPQDQTLQKALTAAGSKGSSVIFNNVFLKESLSKNFPEGIIPVTPLTGWSVLDLQISAGGINFNGVSIPGETADLLNIFDELKPQPSQLAGVVPVSASGFYSFTYKDFQKLNERLNSFRKDSLTIGENHLLNFSRETGLIFAGESPILVLVSTDPELSRQAIKASPELPEDFRGITIFRNTENNQLLNYLHPLIKEAGTDYYAFLDQFIIFAETPAQLENIILNYSNENTLEKQELYQASISGLAQNSSVLIAGNTSNLISALKEAAAAVFVPTLDKLNATARSVTTLQFVADKGFSHIHGNIINSKEKAREKSEIQQIAALNLDAAVGSQPVLVKNHLNNQMEILVQDVKNVLYLFSSLGELRWKKQLESRITGIPQQVDLFKNGNLQFAFSTQNSLQILDRNGNSVKPFPLEFRDEITKPLAIFDYDNNRNYRFVITQNEQVFMFDKNAKPVSGFNFKKAGGEILKSPKHIRIKNKDYILIPEKGGKLHILSRQGNPRIQVKEKIDFSDNEWYLHENMFTSVTAAEELIQIDENGAVKREAAYANNPKFSATQNHRAGLSENILKINGEQITLDFGIYTAPKIFQSKGTSYISVTDTQAGRLFLFDSEASLFPGFPVYGRSSADLEGTSGDRYPLIIVKGEEDSVIVYKILKADAL